MNGYMKLGLPSQKVIIWKITDEGLYLVYNHGERIINRSAMSWDLIEAEIEENRGHSPAALTIDILTEAEAVLELL